MIHLPALSVVSMTAYGKILLIKPVSVAVVLLLATWNRFSLTDQTASGKRQAAFLPHCSTRVEFMLVIISK